MTDVHNTLIRSRNMAAVKSRNTKPELKIRRALHAAGFRYRVHQHGLPGKPDIVLRRFHAVIFVNGCFWHGHNCSLFKTPSSNSEFWLEKIGKNKARDQKNIQSLTAQGWRVAVIWECTMKGTRKWPEEDLLGMISDWIQSSSDYIELRELLT